MKTYQRAVRRHHRTKLLKKRKNYWNWRIEDGLIHKRVINTPKPCSCFMCSNMRRYWGETTPQEQRFEEFTKHQINTAI